MPRMTPEQFEAYQARSKTGHPLKDALVAAPLMEDADAFRHTQARDEDDAEAVAAGTEIEALHNEIIKECLRRGWEYVHSNPARKATTRKGTPDFVIAA